MFRSSSYCHRIGVIGIGVSSFLVDAGSCTRVLLDTVCTLKCFGRLPFRFYNDSSCLHTPHTYTRNTRQLGLFIVGTPLDCHHTALVVAPIQCFHGTCTRYFEKDSSYHRGSARS